MMYKLSDQFDLKNIYIYRNVFKAHGINNLVLIIDISHDVEDSIKF